MASNESEESPNNCTDIEQNTDWQIIDSLFMISTLHGRQIRDLDYLARVSEGEPCNLHDDLAYVSWVGPALQCYSIHRIVMAG